MVSLYKDPTGKHVLDTKTMILNMTHNSHSINMKSVKSTVDDSTKISKLESRIFQLEQTLSEYKASISSYN